MTMSDTKRLTKEQRDEIRALRDEWNRLGKIQQECNEAKATGKLFTEEQVVRFGSIGTRAREAMEAYQSAVLCSAGNLLDDADALDAFIAELEAEPRTCESKSVNYCGHCRECKLSDLLDAQARRSKP